MRPQARADLDDLQRHPSVLVRELDRATASELEDLLERAGLFDPLATQVVRVSRARGWPVVTADPHRLRRIDPGVEVELL